MDPVTIAVVTFTLIFASLPGTSRTSKDPEPQAYFGDQNDVTGVPDTK